MMLPHFHLPPPPPGQEWCLPCAIYLKTAIATECKAGIEAIAKRPGEGTTRLEHRAPHGWELQPAVLRGICAEMQQLGIVPVCWDHLAMIGRASPLAMNGGGQLPPGLLRGQG